MNWRFPPPSSVRCAHRAERASSWRAASSGAVSQLDLRDRDGSKFTVVILVVAPPGPKLSAPPDRRKRLVVRVRSTPGFYKPREGPSTALSARWFHHHLGDDVVTELGVQTVRQPGRAVAQHGHGLRAGRLHDQLATVHAHRGRLRRPWRSRQRSPLVSYAVPQRSLDDTEAIEQPPKGVVDRQRFAPPSPRRGHAALRLDTRPSSIRQAAPSSGTSAGSAVVTNVWAAGSALVSAAARTGSSSE